MTEVWAVRVVVLLAAILVASVLWGATHHSSRGDDCVYVLTDRHGPRCLP